MRPVEKGTRTDLFKPYTNAVEPLVGVIGRYCSYCEMRVGNSIEVEHVVSLYNGGEAYSWENFLLSCKHCNGPSNKGYKVKSRADYCWPDQDNTFLGVQHADNGTAEAHPMLNSEQSTIATNTIILLGLDRSPCSKKPPTNCDKRHMERDTAWKMAQESLSDWAYIPTVEMKRQIVRTAIGHGFFSIWMTVFHDIPEIKLALIGAFPGTAKNCFNQNGSPVARPGGKI